MRWRKTGATVQELQSDNGRLEAELRVLARARDADHQTVASLKQETQELAANRAAMQQEVQRLQAELQRVATEVGLSLIHI